MNFSFVDALLTLLAAGAFVIGIVAFGAAISYLVNLVLHWKGKP